MSSVKPLPDSIASLAYQPRHIMSGMIQMPEPVAATSLPPRSLARTYTTRLEAFGRFDALSLELLHMSFAFLDFRSLAQLSRTCTRGRQVVESLPEYRDTRENAAQTLAALACTRLIRHHSAATVNAALHRENCASCGAYGAFCFLPTSERCCYHCLATNESLWVIPVTLAAECFQLTVQKVKRLLPVMRSIPGKYYVRHGISRLRHMHMVSVRSVKKLAIEEFGSEQALADALETRRANGLDAVEYHKFRWLQSARLVSGPASPCDENRPNDGYCGMASIPFPSISRENGVQRGLWCLGCEHLHRNWAPGAPLPEEAASRLPWTSDVRQKLLDLSLVSRSEAAFADHIAHCTGAQALLAGRS